VSLTFSTLIIDLIEGMISFLTSGVPDVELYLATSSLYCLAEATGIDGTDLFVVEVALAETQRQRCLSNTSYLRLTYSIIPSPSTTILKVPNFFSIL